MQNDLDIALARIALLEQVIETQRTVITRLSAQRECGGNCSCAKTCNTADDFKVVRTIRNDKGVPTHIVTQRPDPYDQGVVETVVKIND